MALSLAPSPVASPRVRLLPRRKRGAQFGNRNAFTHGLYSSRSSSNLATINATLASFNAERRLSPGTATRHSPMLLFMASRALHSSDDSCPSIAEILLSMRLIKTSFRLKIAHANLPESKNQRENLRLAKAAENPLSMICFSFCEHDITRDAYSFLDKLPKGDLNSSPSSFPSRPYLEQPLFPYIPDRQWALIAPLIPPRDLRPIKTSRRGRPPANPRDLLGAIFWKLAHSARWQDLPAGSPSMITCRRFYRRLFVSGRLFTIYRRLYADFRRHCRLDLPSFVKKGAFYIINRKVTLRPNLSETWILRTALLFLQLSYQVRRRVQNRRFNGYYFLQSHPQMARLPVLHPRRRRSPATRVIASRRWSSSAAYRDRGGEATSYPQGIPSYPFEPYVPVEASFAWQKWKKMQRPSPPPFPGFEMGEAGGGVFVPQIVEEQITPEFPPPKSPIVNRKS